MQSCFTIYSWMGIHNHICKWLRPKGHFHHPIVCCTYNLIYHTFLIYCQNNGENGPWVSTMHACTLHAQCRTPFTDQHPCPQLQLKPCRSTSPYLCVQQLTTFVNI